MAYLPTPEQLALIEGRGSGLVIAGPGRGKTVTALAVARERLKRSAGKVLFTSFSNVAVRRMMTAVDLSSGFEKQRLEFRTLHGVAMDVLASYGRFAGLKRPAAPMDRFEELLLRAELGSADADADAAILAHAGASGRVPFARMLTLASDLLEASPSIRGLVAARYALTIVDEFQDTSDEQWRFLKLLAEDCDVLALGDPDQMIYGHQYDAALRRLESFEQWKAVSRVPFEGPSQRCARSAVVQFGEALLAGVPGPRNGLGLDVYKVYKRDQLRARLAQIWIRFVRASGSQSKSIAFVVPSHGMASRVAEDLRAPSEAERIPISIRARMEAPEERRDALELFAYAAADHVATRTSESLRALSVSLAVLVQLHAIKKKVPSVADYEKRLAPASRSRGKLRGFLLTAQPGGEIPAFLEGLLAAAASDSEFRTTVEAARRHGIPRLQLATIVWGGLGERFRAERVPRMDGFVPNRSRTNILSMHRCKGREFDEVVLVVDPRMHAAGTPLDELRRLHYVAATRPRERLHVVYVESDPGPVLEPVISVARRTTTPVQSSLPLSTERT